ncbi:hypothetical protein KAZ01_03920 [Candidatus Gracilibacteria bacterium]|nr:hypothetical protein [Candidatus Gracilibacteria bacterium]
MQNQITFEEYIQFKNWIIGKYVEFYDRYKVYFYDLIYQYKENDIIPIDKIWSSTGTLDVFLIQNCKIQFVQDFLLQVYGLKEFNRIKTVDLSGKPPENFKKNRKIIIFKKSNNRCFKGKRKWWLQCLDTDFGYNDITKKWSKYGNQYETYTNTATFKTVKAAIKHLRKQSLPSGLTFVLSGRYIWEEYKILIK